MTEKSLQKCFSQHGVIKFGAVGDVFDPSLHDALFSVPDATKTSGTTPIAAASLCSVFSYLLIVRLFRMLFDCSLFYH